jgi:hypothetical protein
MQFEVGDRAIEVETDLVFQVKGISGKGRKTLLHSNIGKTFYQSDCTHWYEPQDIYEDARRMIAAAESKDEALAIYKHFKAFFEGEIRLKLWDSLSRDQKEKLKHFAAIAKSQEQVQLVAA